MNEPNSEKLDEIYDDLMKLERLLDLVKKELNKSLIANFEEVRTRQATLNLTQDLAAYAPDIKDRLRNKIIKDKIKTVMATLRRVQGNGTRN